MTITDTPAELVSPDLFDRLVTRVAADQEVDQGTAVRIVNQALAFLATVAAKPGVPIGPSKLVDAGWHAFVLHTRDYAEFCHRVAGRFIHHDPGNDPAGPSLADTVTAMRQAGHDVDDELWGKPAKCSQCYAGCVESRPPPPPK